MKNAIPYILIMIAIQACSHKKTNQQSHINSEEIKIVNMPEKYTFESNISTIFKQVEYIPLETSKDCFLVNPLKAAYNNMHYYILDFRRGLYVFDNKGNYLHQIGKIGRGPNEFIEINDFDFDDQGNVLILDYKRILRYNPDGKIIDKFSEFDFMKNEFYCNPYQFAFIDKSSFYVWGGTLGINDTKADHFAMYRMNNNNLVSGFFPLKYKLSDKQHRFLRCGQEILIDPILGNDTIYSIIEGNVYAKYFIKFKYGVEEKTIPNQLSSLSDFGFEIFNNNNISYDILNPLESPNWLSFTFTYRKNRVITLFDKRKNRIYTIKGFSSERNKSEILMPYYFHFMHDNSFCSMVTAREFLTIKEGINKLEGSVNLINLNGKLVNINDNHIILKYKPF